MSNPTGYRKNEPTQPLRSGHPTVSANLQAATAPCGDVAPPVIDVTCGCLLRSPVKEDRDTVKRVRRSKATWGNIIASRYRAVASWLRARRSRYHGNLWWRNRADFARHGAVVGRAGRTLCRPIGGRRLARAGGLPCVLLGP